MRLRRRYLPLAAVLGAAAAILPAIAASETTPTIEALNTKSGIYSEEHHAWSPTQVAVMAGGVVTFQNSSASVPHGVVWDSGNPETPSCAGVPVNEGNISWKGTCTFAHAGTYSFHCYVHPTEMTGTVEVSANGTTTTMTTTPTTTSTTTTTGSPAGPPLVGATSLRSSRRDGAIKGSLDVAQAGAGDRLEVDVFASSGSLAGVRRSTRVRVGRYARNSVTAGTVSFVVKLNAKARNALRRHRRLALTVKITLKPVSGEPFSVTRTVVEHG